MNPLTKSQNEYQTAKQLVTGGVHSSFRYREPHPVYFQKAEGSVVTDIDGNNYLDYLVANGACILGHKNPKVTEFVRKQLDTGLTVGLESELSIRVAKLMHNMIPSAEIVKFSNTGSEAVMHAFQIARGYTGKTKIVKAEGCYHGWQDEAHVSVHPKMRKGDETMTSTPIPDSEGLSPSALENIEVVPYNDAESVSKLMRTDGKEVAALIIEPVMFNSGCVLPKEGYLRELREITESFGILLIFDEIITGFRMAPGGAQEYYKVKPDISIFGKAIANGFPLSAVVGSKDVMKVTTPRSGNVGFAGTYNGNQPSLAASEACLDQLRDGSVQRKLHNDTDVLAKQVSEIARDLHISCRLQGIAGEFQIYFTHNEVSDYQSAARCDQKRYEFLANYLFEHGVLVHQSYLFHHGTSWSHTSTDISNFIQLTQAALNEVKSSIET